MGSGFRVWGLRFRMSKNPAVTWPGLMWIWTLGFKVTEIKFLFLTGLHKRYYKCFAHILEKTE